MPSGRQGERSAVCRGFGPAKALVGALRGLPLSRSLSFRVIGILVAPARCLAWNGTTPNRLVARWGKASGEDGGHPA